jgi:hypothetical protein
LKPRKQRPSVLPQQAKMQDRSPPLSTAESTVIAIAAAGGGTAVVTAAASATGADVQSDGPRHSNEKEGSWHMEPSFSASALPDLESGTGIA